MRGCRPSATSPHRTSPLSARQRSRAFNQPLNFDTSNVVNMDEMFEAHSARRILWPILLSSLPLFARCIMRFAPPLSDPPASYAPLLTRQEATAFNQPLNFDTSRVIIMGEMFRVLPPLPCAQTSV